MEAFQLRLWDGRIGRWLDPDPKGQYFSPYLGMGNNPISRIDPDGGLDGDPGKGSWLSRIWNGVTSFFGGSKELTYAGNGGQPLPEVIVNRSVSRGGGFAIGAGAIEGAATIEATVSLSTVLAYAASLAPALAVSDTPELEELPYVYRHMRSDGYIMPRPMLGQSLNTLGIRPKDVSYRDFSQKISGNDKDGMSVTIGLGTYKSDSLGFEDVPYSVAGKTTLYRISPALLAPFGLKVTLMGGTYARITPLYSMSIHSFNKRIQMTQSLWRIAPSNR